MQLPSEHHVEFREAEHKRVTLVDEHDVNGIAESIERIVVSSRPPNRAPRTTTRGHRIYTAGLLGALTSTSSVPEPATMSLLALGLAASLFGRARQRVQ